MADPAGSRDTREWFVVRDRSRLYVREVGAGRTIIVLHGGPDFDHEYLLPEMDRLAARFRLVYYDQRGRGRSFAGEGAGDVTIESEMEDLDAVRQAAGVETIALLGHSFGGLLAMEYAIRHPERVSHLILMNTAPVSHAGAQAFRREVKGRRSAEQAARMRELVADPGYRRGEVEPDAEYHRIHFGTSLTPDRRLDALVGRLRLGFTAPGIVAARAIEQSLYEQTWDREDYDLGPALRRVTSRVLVIHGDHDLCPADAARELAGAIPEARLAVIDDCGHFAYLERPGAVMSLVADFLGADVDAATPS